MTLSRAGSWLAIGALLAGAACNGAAREAPAQRAASDARALVVGTVVDAATGEPLAGIKVVGPHDSQCVSGRDGRFELEGLRAGDAGTLSASASDGRAATLALRPLGPGRLEVVLRLAQR